MARRMLRRRAPLPVPDLQRWGVDPGYHDAAGAWHEAPPGTVAAVLDEMGAGERSGPDGGGGSDSDGIASSIMTVRLDHPLPPVPAGMLEMEDGAEILLDGALPADVPCGYHRLTPDDRGTPFSLVVSPGLCPPGPDRQWGWAAQLYATRSAASWGHGDLADLRRLSAWSAQLGAGMTLVNPLHAGALGAHPQPSPYFPSSRCFLSPLYLRIEEIPGAEGVAELDAMAGVARLLNDEPLIDRGRVWALKSVALEQLFERFDGDADFDRFRAQRGPALEGFAVFNTLAEIHGPGWAQWPETFRRPDALGARAVTTDREGARRVLYHQWLQWHLDDQLRRASEATAVMADLAIGVDAGGADAWLWQDTFASTMRVGAPPDEFNTQGQDWGLPPWDPWRLRAADYRPFIETIRGGMGHGGALRFDHVMGLFRLYWIPEGRSPTEGTYVRYPHWDLLNILALEAARAGAYIVGEDLGTVEDHVRQELSERRVLSYRLLWFEPDRPRTWPAQTLGSVTTHDLPTVAGVWSGSDLDDQRSLGLAPNEVGVAAMRERLIDWSGVSGGSDKVSCEGVPADEVVRGAYRSLAEAPCSVVTATLDDALVVEKRPNMPGTVDAWPNWCIALPRPLEEIETSPLVADLAAILSGRTPGLSGGDGAGPLR
ncbi:MAG: 4-alpha-glucanotransferase [Actinomycetota bacterium]|nr:4-alpha-glucanotransferase [Actinomycetota bacterium]